MKKVKTGVAIFLSLVMLMSFGSIVFADAGEEIEQIKKIYKRSYIELDFFAALSLISSGEQIDGDLYKLESVLPESVDENAVYESRSQLVSDLSKFILINIASGKNPNDNTNIDTVKVLKDFQEENGSFCNELDSDLLAVLALKSAKEEFDENKAVEYILSCQYFTGEFSVDKPSLETTGLALTVLSLYTDVSGVSDSIKVCVSYLKSVQTDGGTFIIPDEESTEGDTEETENAQQPVALCRIISGLTDCGYDVTKDEFLDMERSLSKYKNDSSHYVYNDDDFTSSAFFAYDTLKNSSSSLKRLAIYSAMQKSEEKSISFIWYVLGFVFLITVLYFVANNIEKAKRAKRKALRKAQNNK